MNLKQKIANDIGRAFPYLEEAEVLKIGGIAIRSYKKHAGPGAEAALTRRQIDLLKFIDSQRSETGLTPSFDEMCQGIDLKSKSGIHRLISELEERGCIDRLKFRPRAIHLTELGKQAMANPKVGA